MGEIVGCIVIAIFLSGLLYSLSNHIRLIKIGRSFCDCRRVVAANYLSVFALAGFLIAFLFNTGTALDLITSTVISNSAANAVCYLFLGILIISKAFISPHQIDTSL